MKRFFLLVLTGITLVFSSCDSTKQLAKTAQSAQQAFDRGEYAKALGMWEEVISSYKQKDAVNQCPVYTNAGIAAYRLGQTDKAIDYLKQADWSDFNNEETYLTLAEIYRKKDNLSLELVNLETYLNKFPQGSQTAEVKKRLFELYVESDNLDKAVHLWDTLSADQQSDLSVLEGFLKVNKKLKNDDKCLELSLKILETDKNNTEALKWLANYYFWKGEKLYQKEMKAYNAHKTRKQYAHLLKALDVVTADMKQSLKYAGRLYEIEPTAKTAGLLSKCYTRLDDKKKAARYKKLSNDKD